jgi:hypothetical protein
MQVPLQQECSGFPDLWHDLAGAVKTVKHGLSLGTTGLVRGEKRALCIHDRNEKAWRPCGVHTYMPYSPHKNLRAGHLLFSLVYFSL